MKPPTWSIIVMVVLSCCVPFAWWKGHEAGVRKGAKLGEWQTCKNTLSFILSSKFFEEADPTEADKIINDGLYMTASHLEMNQHAKMLSREDRATGEELLSRVGSYYWENPENSTLGVDRESFQTEESMDEAVTEAFEPLLHEVDEQMRRVEGLLLRYKPNAEQEIAPDR